jgi:Ca2+/Na+ antiporter
MRAGAGSLALGELLGAGLFITLVVVGSISITAPAQLPR